MNEHPGHLKDQPEVSESHTACFPEELEILSY
jgi:hypothetical protein